MLDIKARIVQLENKTIINRDNIIWYAKSMKIVVRHICTNSILFLQIDSTHTF